MKSSWTSSALSWLILILLFVVPLPLGSNRPFFWSVNGGLVAILGVMFGLIWLTSGEEMRIKLGALGTLPWAFAVVIFYLALQMAPIVGGRPLSVAPGDTLLMMQRMITYGIFFILVLQVCLNPHRAARFLSIALVMVTVHAMLALFLLRSGDTLLGLEKTAYLGSATGTFINRNSFATFLAFGSVIAFAKLLADLAKAIDGDTQNEHPWLRVWLNGLAFAALSATLLATQSRMGAAAATVGLLVVGLQSLGAFGRRRLLAVAAIAAVLVVAVFVIVLNSDGLLQRLMSTEQSWGDRVTLYRQVIELIAMRPWTGFGGGAFHMAFQQVHAPPLGIDRVWDKAHNSYLTLFAELGIVVGMIVPLILSALTVRLLKVPHASVTERLPVTVALGTLAVGAAHSLVDFSLEIQAVTFWFLALVGCGTAQVINLQRKIAAQARSQDPLPIPVTNPA